MRDPDHSRVSCAALGFRGLPGSRVNLVNHRERGVRVTQGDERASPRLDCLHESLELEPPGIVFAWVFPDGRFGRAHGGLHLVVAQLLDAVAAAESFDVQLRVPPEYFE